MSKLVDSPLGGKINRFEPGESGNPNGRPKKFIGVMKAEGYKLSQIIDAFTGILALRESQLNTILKNPKATVLEKALAKAMQEAIRTGNVDVIEQIISRAYGKPVSHLNMPQLPSGPMMVVVQADQEITEEGEAIDVTE